MDEIAAFLVERGPSMATEIASGVRARRVDVDAALALERFSRVKRPVGASPQGVYYAVSRRVPQPRAQLLLEILADGVWRSREEILRLAGRTFLTNNAAAELRRAGHVVKFERGGYRLVSLAAPESSLRGAPSGSGAASEIREAAAA